MTESKSAPLLPRVVGLVALVLGSALAGALMGPKWLASGRSGPVESRPGRAAVSAPDSVAPDQPVAIVAGERVLGADLERAIETQMVPIRARLEKNLADERRKLMDRALKGLIEERLVAAEARARGITPETLLEQETGITSADVDAYFEKKPLTGTLTREQVEPRLRNYLAGENRTKLLAELRERLGVEILLEPERQRVAAEDAPAKGPEGAPVELVLFSDFQCPFCARVVPTLHQIEERYGGKVRIAFRQFPLTAIHPQAYGAAEAALCADEQGKFWELHDALFADQKALAPERIVETAGVLGIDIGELEACLGSDRVKRRVDADLAAGRALGLSGTPAAFVNGRLLSGAQPLDAFATVIDDELARLRAAAKRGAGDAGS